jgi:hypothetical protein
MIGAILVTRGDSMSRVCTICTHADRRTIDRELIAGTSNRRIAAQFSVAEASVRRHKKEHLAATLREARAEEEEDRRLDVAQQLRAINGATMRILSEARMSGDPNLALRAVDRVLKQLELQAKLLGDLDTRPQVNLILSPDWIELRGTIVQALRPYPAAAVAVADAVATIEAGAR